MILKNLQLILPHFWEGILSPDRLTESASRTREKYRDEKLKELSFSILQATEARITRVTYLSCPTCGRTKFDLQEAVKKVKAVTGHLTGLKIAVMGCIVNGPGEMAGC